MNPPRTLAVLPVKRFETAKSRLEPALQATTRQALARAMACDVLDVLVSVDEIESVVVVTSDPVAAGDATDRQAGVLDDDDITTHSEATCLATQRALATGFDRVLLMAGDCPLVSRRELSTLMSEASAERLGAVIAVDRHETGTNALLLEPPAALSPQFGPDSARLHRKQAEGRRLRHRVAAVRGLRFDVDTEDDLAALLVELRLDPSGASATRSVLAQL